ncbi:sunset domain-containing protein [Gordonia sp. NPDC003424]
MTTSATRRRFRATGLACGFTAAAGTTLAAAPLASADPRLSNIAAGDASGFGWWWLIIPLLLIFAGILFAWLLRQRKPKISPTEQHLSQPVVPSEPATPDTDLKTTTTGTAAAAAAGAAAAGAAMKSRGGGDAPEAESGAPEAEPGGAAGPATSTEQSPASDDAVPQLDANAVAATESVQPVADSTQPAPADAVDAPVAAPTPDESAPPVGVGRGDGVGHYLKDGAATPVPIGAHLPVPDSDRAPEGYPIKGIANAGVYLTPDLDSYHQTAADLWFATESAAESGGFRRAEA